MTKEEFLTSGSNLRDIAALAIGLNEMVLAGWLIVIGFD
jgi:hypothetical protein